MLFSEATIAFLDHLRVVRNVSPHTLRNYGLDFKHFAELSKITHIEQVDKRGVRNYLAALSEKKAPKRTILHRLSALRSLFKFLIREKKIAASPLDEIDSPKLEKRIPPTLTYSQVEHLFSLPDTTTYLGLRDRAMMELFYSSGLRISELTSLSRGDIDHAAHRLKVKGKGKKERVVPMTQTAAKWLSDYLNHPERQLDGEKHQAEKDPAAVFLNRWGKRLTVRSVDRLFAAYLIQSGLSGRITPHVIRHTIATHWLEKGMDLKTIQMILGHNSLATTTIYTQVSTKLKRDVYEKAHPRALEKKQ